MSSYPDNFSSFAADAYFGSASTRPGRREVEFWAAKMTADFIAAVTDDFDKRFAFYGDPRPGEIDADTIRQMLEEYAWNVVRRAE
jgi:hypothetical protein